MDELTTVVLGPTEHTRVCLELLLRDPDLSVQGVVTLPDALLRKKARGAYFDDLAERYHFPVCRARLSSPEAYTFVARVQPDIIFEFGSSEIVSSSLLSLPRLGLVGSHGGVLPRVRGGSTLNWALIRGETTWGVTLYYLAEGIDTGDIIETQEFPVEVRDDISTLHTKSDAAILTLLQEHLDGIKSGTAPRMPNVCDDPLRLPQRKPKDGIIDWHRSSRDVYNLVRALTHPFPGAFTYLGERKVIVWRADYSSQTFSCSSPGTYDTLLPGRGITVACGSSTSLVVERLQAEHDVAMWADDFIQKYHLQPHTTRFSNG